MPNGENFNTETGDQNIDGVLIGTRWEHDEPDIHVPDVQARITIRRISSTRSMSTTVM
jgi:hypothetical protein